MSRSSPRHARLRRRKKNAFRGFFLLKYALKTNINFLPDVLWGQISKNSASFFHSLHPWHICCWRCCLYSFSSLQGEDNTFVFRRFVLYSRLLLSSEGGEKKPPASLFRNLTPPIVLFLLAVRIVLAKRQASCLICLLFPLCSCLTCTAYGMLPSTYIQSRSEKKSFFYVQSNNVTKIK